MEPILQRRLESCAIIIGCVMLYHSFSFSWWTFTLLFFTPDLAIFAYFKSPRVGAIAYNLSHFFLLPISLFIIGINFEFAVAQQIALIWASHIAFDRLLGWGLKFSQGFCHTDMGLKQLSIKTKILS